ncbi:MAG: hypothetical protein AMS19_00095 [Gemmatimonas sp. SG8_23]|jgi:hypothetical protein|nr:MAG: hypothetical protein AMS19_00095 [Gemmatimonas sp. SG8_23]
MKSFAKLAFVGASSIVLLKLFTTVLIPVLGMMLGLLMLTVKLAVIAAVVFFLYSLLRPRPSAEEAEGGIEREEELEIVVEEAPESGSA